MNNPVSSCDTAIIYIFFRKYTYVVILIISTIISSSGGIWTWPLYTKIKYKFSREALYFYVDPLIFGSNPQEK